MNYSLKSREYFLTYIDEEQKRIDKFQKIKLECANKSQIDKCNLVLMNFHKNIICCMIAINKIDKDLLNIVKSYLSLLDLVKDSVSEADKIDELAIKYLFIDDSNLAFEKLLTKLKELSCYEVYSSFCNILSSKNLQDDLKTFMNEKWYNQCVEYSWYDSHLRENNTYVGYVSFVASAIAKRFNLDTTGINYVVKLCL